MTPPPPAEPLRPIGPIAGGTWVARAEQSAGVLRRPRRDRDSGQQHGHGHEPEQPPEHETWNGGLEPADEAGTYDDHGRVGAPDAAADAAARRHVDTSA